MTGQLARVDIKQIRSRVEVEGHDLVRAHLFPIILDGAVSQQKTANDMRSTAEKVHGHMLAAGIENARVIQHEGCYPAVFGEIKADVDNAPTILIGGHYDGQPSAEKQWN